MKKIFTILFALLGIGFLFCFAAGMILPVKESVPSNSMFLYKLCSSIEYFTLFLPAMVITAFVISLSVFFGHNSEGSLKRFSAAMGARFKLVIISGLVCTFLLTISNETVSLLVKQKKENIINKPKIITEYIDVGNVLLSKGFEDRALIYANAALKLNPNSNEARDLKSKAEMEINSTTASNLRFDLSSSQPLVETDNSMIIETQKISDSYNCYLKSKSAFDNEEWFNAHYYAEQGIKLASSKDPNIDEMKLLSAQAWNNIITQHKEKNTEGYDIFSQKYDGYLALMNKDDLQAYYIFRQLYDSSAELQRDPDIQFYLDVAMNRIEQEYFFVDETLELETFENANDVYFVCKHKNGTSDLVYFKGVTYVKSTGQSIQYLRDLTIVSMDRNGKWTKKMNVPYAKLMPVDVGNLNSDTKLMLDIEEDTDLVPYILLRSVGRDDSSIQFGPTYTYPDGREETSPDYLIFPLEYSEFLMLEDSPSNPETNSIINLYKIAKSSLSYGYAEEQYGLIFLNRILYPFFLLALFILLASFAWDNRIGENQMFKFSWVFSFPFLIVLGYFVYTLLFRLFKLTNYVLLGLIGGMTALFAGIALSVVIMIVLSIFFLSRYSA